MAGFGKVTFVGEYYNQKIVNVFHFRSTDWLPGGGNPFDDVQAFVDAVLVEYQTPLLDCLPGDYTLRTVEGVGYDDTYKIVTASPIIRTVNVQGARGEVDTNGASTCAIIGLRCGEQVQISDLTGKSKRNRGYVAVGPMSDGWIDNYQHIVDNEFTPLENLAGHLDNQIPCVTPAATLIPVRIHEKWTKILGKKVLLWRTYSDVLGYRVNRLASVRRSRFPEA